MKHPWRVVLVVFLVALAAGLAFLEFRHHGRSVSGAETGALSQKEESPKAWIKTAVARSGVIDDALTVYGNVIPAPGSEINISVSYESKISRVMVNAGQQVAPGDVLLEVGPSPDTRLKLDQAQIAYEGASAGLKQMERRFGMKLATNDQLQQTRQTFQDAEANLESLKNRGIGGERQIKAEAEGLVTNVAAQAGSIVQAGTTLLQMVPGKGVELRFGVEPEDINKISVGMPVAVTMVLVAASQPIAGRIRTISRSVNAATRLVDVFVSVESPQKFLLGQYVAGRITVLSSKGILVPRSAIMLEKEEFTLFIVRQGKAIKRSVQIGAENQNEVSVVKGDLNPGDKVVVLGNYELKDNMPVVEDGR